MVTHFLGFFNHFYDFADSTERWLVISWFYVSSTLVGLSNTEVNLYLVSNSMVSSNSWQSFVNTYVFK